MKEEFRICLELKDGSGIWLNREAYESYKRGEWDPNAPSTPQAREEALHFANRVMGQRLLRALEKDPAKTRQELREHPEYIEWIREYQQYKKEHPESDL